MFPSPKTNFYEIPHSSRCPIAMSSPPLLTISSPPIPASPPKQTLGQDLSDAVLLTMSRMNDTHGLYHAITAAGPLSLISPILSIGRCTCSVCNANYPFNVGRMALSSTSCECFDLCCPVFLVCLLAPFCVCRGVCAFPLPPVLSGFLSDSLLFLHLVLSGSFSGRVE